MKQASAILCADLHVRETSPECRTDNFMETQARKYKWLRELQEKHHAPILVAGDLFNHWKPSPYLLSWALRNLPDNIIAIPGQHDLPAHNLQDIEKSGIQVLADAGKIELLTDNREWFITGNDTVIHGVPWGMPMIGIEPHERPTVAVIHYGVYESKPHYPGAENSGGTAKSVINKMKGFDLILSGDNHLTFICKHNNQVLVNPGSFMRTTAAQIDHKPSVFLWYADTNEIEQVYIPIEKGVISREHIDKVVERDERLESFIGRLDHAIELGISYKTNMRNYLAKNTIPKRINDLIWGTMQ